mmetsp:Transcript_5531/g.12265  ORF Transcript_5531/g.12265 Transcript_5531/m.12265 type:complete len:541 (-) Transcript_5531:110-1732(-)
MKRRASSAPGKRPSVPSKSSAPARPHRTTAAATKTPRKTLEDDDDELGDVDDDDGVDDDDESGKASAARRQDEDEDEEDEARARESAQEKRIRLAKAYLERLRQEQAEESEDEDEAGDEDGEGRHLDSHTRLAARLADEAQRKSGHQRAAVGDRVKVPAEVQGEPQTWRGHKRAVTGVALTEDDRLAYSVSKDGTIFGWDIETGKRLKFPRTPEVVVDPLQGGTGPQAPPKCGAHVMLCCAVSGEKNLFVTGGADKRVHVWDTRSMTHITSFPGHRGAVTGLGFRHGTGQLFSCSEDRTVKIWSLDDMAYVDTLFGHQDRCIAIDTQRRERIVTVGADRSARFWKVPEDSQLVLRPAAGDGQAESCAFTAHDHWLTGSQDGCVAIWNIARKKAAASWENVHGFREIVAPKSFDDDAVRRAMDQRAAAQAVSGMSAKNDGGVGEMASWVNAVHVGKGTDFAASGAADGTIRLWKTSHQGEPLVPLHCLAARGFVNALQVASSGRFVLAGMGQEPRLGRWGRDSGAKNGLQLHMLELEKERF